MSLKKLYVAKCMKDLESETELKQNIKTKSTNLLVSSADKVFRGAQEKYIDKDEEAAYVQYMRFIELVLLLQKRPDFKKVENRNRNQLLEQANTAITKAEILKESLRKRYAILEKATAIENEKNTFLTVIKSGQSYGNPSDVLPENVKDKEKLFISTSELYSLITSEKSSIVIMDTRPAKDFEESHIKYHACINVPQEIIKPGLTAAKLESALPKESLSLWFKHTDVDQVILIDWDSENEITLNVCLNILKSAITQNSSLKKAPLIVKGGYKGWMKKYPMLATQVLNLDQLNDSRNSITSDTLDKEMLSISSSELYSLIMAGQSAIIIMDTRPASDFAESHIKYSGCISIPQEILKPGLTAAKLEGFLPKESLAEWYKRKDADFIILVDWESKDETTQNIHLNSLKLAMLKWDQSCVLKKSPMVLRGGYKDFMRKYPMCTTQALNFDLMTSSRMNPVVTDLSDIEYPNLDESVNNEVQMLNEKNSNDMLFKKCHSPDFIINGISPTSTNSRKSVSAPIFDRKSKPINTPNKLSNVEVRSNKSFSTSANNRNFEDSMSDKKLPPPVNRKSKSAILNSVTDETDFNNDAKDSVLIYFNKEQSLAKESVDIANQKLKKEEEFEKLCLRKELEAEESKRVEIQKQEEKLLQKIKQLQIQSAEKEAELKEVKEENFKIRKLLDEQVDKEYKVKKEQEIKDALKKQIELRESVERMREERKRKEAENQKKKEIHPLPSRDIASANPVLRRADTNPASAAANPSEYTMPLSKEIPGDSSGRGLVRSHSSPNIAQMMNEEECAQQKIPSIDRSLKPRVVNVNSALSEINRARQRNLNPLYGNCPVRPATGLRNLGNTCFMNSVIQCLSNTIPLADYINSGQYVENICRDNKQGTGGELVEEFAAVIKALWMGQYKSFYPRDFKNTVSKCLAVCIGNEQQDSHEFLVVLMEKLHADLNKKYIKNPPKLDPNCNENMFWQHHRNYNSSKISDIFDGLLKSTLTCLSCRKTSDSFEVFSCLSLPIMTSKCTLKECFQHFLRAEKISGEAAWDCPRCKQKKEAEKRLRICRAPEVLIIQLKRFSYEGLWRRKLQTHVDFDFNMEVPYEINGRECYRMYSLYGIVNHYGTLEGGHYTAYCKTNTGKWFKYDDHEVGEISSSDIKTSAAYLLFYISTDFQSRL